MILHKNIADNNFERKRKLKMLIDQKKFF